MSAVRTTARRRLAAGRFEIAGAVAALLALAGALQSGPAGDAITVGFAGAAGVIALGLLAMRTARRRPTSFDFARGVVGVGTVAVVVAVVATFDTDLLLGTVGQQVGRGAGEVPWPLVAVLGWSGIALVAGWLVANDERLSRIVTPWESIGRGRPAVDGEGSRHTVSGAVGVLLLSTAVFLVGVVVAGIRDVAEATTIYGAFVLLGVLAGAPLLGLEQARRRRAAVLAERLQERQEVGAHLHDSVLQTLAMIRRGADDPARVTQLARQQERGLRDWLAGRDAPADTTIAGALRVAAQQVEDEESGALIEVVTVGDAPFDHAANVMVRAAREGMRNAVRHGGGQARVFLEVESDRWSLFVRDEGPGFVFADVPGERRGIKDAIIGRMEQIGGTAKIESGSAGTELSLGLSVIPRAGGGR